MDLDLIRDLVKILLFLGMSYLCWRAYKWNKKIEKKLEELEELEELEALREQLGENVLERMEEGSDFYYLEDRIWCWVHNGEAVTTKEFHLSRGGAIEDYERYVEKKALH